MTLADDCLPADCLEIVAKTIEENAVVLSKNLPGVNDTSTDLARKYAVIENSLEEIRKYTREGLKARKKGSVAIAYDFNHASKHKTLNEFSDEEKDAKVSISVNGEKPVETTMSRFSRLSEAVQKDPSIVDRVIGKEAEAR
jgi:hypothetical protein